jgi:LysR family transcriptional regulator for bpeEF and oprC
MTGTENISYLPRGSLLTSDAEHIRAAVLCGLGIIQVPRWLVEREIRSGELRLILPELQPEPVPINLVYQAGRRVPMRVKVCIDYFVGAFARSESR